MIEDGFWSRLAEYLDNKAAENKAAEVAANRERYVTAWIAETGLNPRHCVLIEQHRADGTTAVWVEDARNVNRIADEDRALAAICEEACD